MLVLSYSDSKLNIIWRGEILLLWNPRRINGLKWRGVTSIDTSFISWCLWCLLRLLGHKELRKKGRSICHHYGLGWSRRRIFRRSYCTLFQCLLDVSRGGHLLKLRLRWEKFVHCFSNTVRDRSWVDMLWGWWQCHSYTLRWYLKAFWNVRDLLDWILPHSACWLW